MKSIYKYKLNLISVEQDIEMPKDAIVLSAGLDSNDDMCIWVAVDNKNEYEIQTIYILGTGWDIDFLIDFLEEENKDLRFINTVRKDPYMWHIFVSERK